MLDQARRRADQGLGQEVEGRDDEGAGPGLVVVLAAGHRRRHPPEEAPGVVLVEGEADHHGRDVVAEGARARRGGADGDQHLQGALGVTAPGEQLPHAARHGGEQDVVDGGAGPVGQGLDAWERHPHGGETPVEPDGDVERGARGEHRGRRQAGQAVGQRAEAPQDLGGVGQVGEVGARPPGVGGETRRHGRPHPVGRRGGRPCPGVVGRRIGAEVEEDGGQGHVGEAVGQGVVHLLEHGDPVARHALDEPDLPQRPALVEGPGQQLGAEPEELLLVTGPGEGGLAHVGGDVEMGIVLPHRRGEAEQALAGPLAQPRGPAEPRRRPGPQLLDAQPAVGGAQGAGLEEADGGAVHGRAGTLEVEEEAVEPGHGLRQLRHAAAWARQ